MGEATLWHIEHDDGVSMWRGEKPIQIVAEDGRTVACNTKYYPTAIDADDACRIVAAVNTHDDLVKYLSIFLGHDDRFQISVGGNPNAVDAMLDEARAALAKAQGE